MKSHVLRTLVLRAGTHLENSSNNDVSFNQRAHETKSSVMLLRTIISRQNLNKITIVMARLRKFVYCVFHEEKEYLYL